VYYHQSGYKTFKDYYTRSAELKLAFPGISSYNRFIELQQKAFMPLAIFAKLQSVGICDGTSFIDSFSLQVSHQKRILSHKTFRGLAARGKTSLGWFYGFKVHLIINTKGEILDFAITPGNIVDNNPKIIEQMMQNIHGKVYGDKGYLLNAELFQKLYSNGIHVVTKIRSNMKNKMMEMKDKIMLKKRGVIESVGAVLKEDLNIEHSRYRSPITLFINVFSALIAYSFRRKKPSIHQNNFGILMAS
jgi:Transposase DDE domain